MYYLSCTFLLILFTSIILTAYEVPAQITDSLGIGNRNKLPIKIEVQDTIALTPENKDYFDIELKDGRIYISNFQFEDGKTASFNLITAESKYGNLRESDIKKRIYSSLDGQRGVYLITDKGILFVIPKLPETTIFEAIQKDTSIVMTCTLLPDEKIVGTTQTTFLLINSEGGTVLDYVDIIGVKLSLKNPTITVGKETNHIIIRDPTLITEDGQQFMIDLDISTFRSKIVPYEQ